MQPAGQNSADTKTVEWATDLLALGYGEPLPAPSPAVQATLASISTPSIHEYILQHDNAAFLDRDEEGEHAPLLLTTLDLSQWTLILALAIKKDEDKCLEQLKLAQDDLPAILDNEVEELEIANHNAKLVELALRKANPHEFPKNATVLADSSVSPAPHPLLGGIIIPQAQKAALEDLVSSIQTSQEEIDLALLTSSGRGPIVPFTPPRTVEYEVAQNGHRCWALPNINLLAPISIHMWRTWANLSLAEVEALKSNVIHNTGLLRDPQDIPNSFPLSLYDHHKCNLQELKVHTKQDLQTGHGRSDKFTSALWNVQRPYLRCLCAKDASTGCRGDIMWFDHATWYMVNNLGTFFPDSDFPTLASKFVAFITWLSEAARVAVRFQVAFSYSRELMTEAALGFMADPNAKLLAQYPDGMGVRKIERLFKPANFSVTNPATPNANVGSKRPRGTINCNASPDTSATVTLQRDSRGRGGHRGARGGRGGYNRRFRPTGRDQQQPRAAMHTSKTRDGNASNANEAFVFLSASNRTSPAFKQLTPGPSPEHASSYTQGPSPSYSTSKTRSPTSPQTDNVVSRTAPRFQRASMKGKSLNWDDIDQ